MQAELIDRIYECAVVPELWPAILDDMSQMTESHGGLLFSANKTLAYTASDTVLHVFEEYVRDGWFQRCSRRVCIMNQSEPSFFREQDFWTDEEIAENPIYRDFFRGRHGLGWSAGTGLSMPTGDNVVFSVERRLERGPVEKDYVEQLNALRPHLARAAFITARLGLKRAEGATDTLTALGLPTLVVDEQGRVVEANDLAAALTGQIGWAAQNRVRLTDRKAQELLDNALVAMTRADSDAPRSFPLRDGAGDATHIAHVVPIERTAHDIFASSFALLMISPVASKRAPPAALLRSLFDLTPAEARVAAGLAEGRTLEDIAAEGSVAMPTTRSQLRKVLEKTGCARQAEVAALLSAINLVPDDG